MNAINGTWAFKCKQFPNGTVKDQQLEGIEIVETFAPIVK